MVQSSPGRPLRDATEQARYGQCPAVGVRQSSRNSRLDWIQLDLNQQNSRQTHATSPTSYLSLSAHPATPGPLSFASTATDPGILSLLFWAAPAPAPSLAVICSAPSCELAPPPPVLDPPISSPDMPLGLQQDSDLVFAPSSTTTTIATTASDGSTASASDFAPSPEHRHAGWTGRRSDSSSSSTAAGLATQQNMTNQEDVEAEGRPPYLHVRFHRGRPLCSANRFRPVRIRTALTRGGDARP